MDARQRASELVDLFSSNDKLLYAKGRWIDEKEYEDFKEYDKFIRTLFPTLNIIKITKSFAITVIENGYEFVCKINTRTVSGSFRKLA